MAASGPRNPLSITTPNQISKDMHGADGAIPLSPQWLLPKPVENKAAFTPGENHVIASIAYGDHIDVIKPGNVEEKHESHKKKDVFRPAFHDSEAGRRDRWRDEERDTNSSVRRDRWRELDKEAGDSRKTDRWVDNSSMRQFGEARRASADRCADLNKDVNFDQRRESKWNTRWGPGDKEMDKWTDTGKQGDMSYDKGVLHPTNHGKDERDCDNYRPWRPSSLQSRGRSEPQHQQTQMASKEGPTFGHGRVRGENTQSFTAGRGRSSFFAGSISHNSGHSQSVGLVSDREDSGHEESSPVRYSRTKLLDVYRFTDIRSPDKILDGLVQVPSLTQEHPLEPLALCALMPEESVILKAIDMGDIVSSGAPQISKEGSAGRSSGDFPHSRQTKHGSKDEVFLSADDANDKLDNSKGACSKNLEGVTHEKQVCASLSNATLQNAENFDIYAASKYNAGAAKRDDVATLNKHDEVSNNADSKRGSTPGQSAIPWRSPSLEHARSPSRDWFDVPSDVRTRNLDIGWSQGLKDGSNEREHSLSDPSHPQSEHKWQISEDYMVGKHPYSAIDREHESRKLMQPAPEDLLLYYKDPQGQIQGPFSGSDIIGWLDAGYFGIDLQVRVAHAASDSPFSSLGDVMPHLRTKARPPPGFTPSKQSEVTEVSGRSHMSGFAKILPGSGGIDLTGTDHRQPHGSSTDAENRFLESLMAGDINSRPLERLTSSEALQGFMGLTSGGISPLGAEGGDALSLLAKRMNLEQQKSLPHPYPYVPARETAPVIPTPDIPRESSVLQPNLLSSMADVPRQSHPQNVEMMAILQGLSDRSSTGMSNGVGAWPNFPVQGLDPFKDKIDLHHGRNMAQTIYGMQHPLQPQHPQSVANLLGQALDSPSVLTDRLLSSGLAQDPQVSHLLQQQYLLQMQSKQPVTVPQLSILDKILLLKQQQKQEEQQQLLRQQLICKVLSDQHLAQQLTDPSCSQLQASASPVSVVPTVHSLPQLSNQLFQVSSQVSDDRSANLSNVPSQVSQGLNDAMVSKSSSLHLPHQIFDAQKSWPSMPALNDNNKQPDSSGLATIENFSEALGESQVAAVLDDATSSEPSLSGDALQKDTSVLDLASGGVGEPWGSSVLSELPESIDKSSRLEDEILISEGTNDEKGNFPSLDVTPIKVSNTEGLTAKEATVVESVEVKKASDRKSRKSKSSKGQASSDQAKVASKVNLSQSKPAETGKLEASVTDGVTSAGMSKKKSRDVPCIQEVESTFSNVADVEFESDSKVEQKLSDGATLQSSQVNAAHRAWKPPVSVKPKSLLEIQQEEEWKAHLEMPASGVPPVSSVSISSLWAGVVTHPDAQVSEEVHQDSNNESKIGETELPKSWKGGLHDLLAQEVLAKSNARETDVLSSLPPLPNVVSQIDVVDDDFIEAKDTKKNRKKAAKAKGAPAKVASSISSADVIAASSPIEKGKVSKHAQAEKEVLSAAPSGPSLGDFVLWKGESTSPSPAPAWTTDSVKLSKPTSLRDILKEQEKKVSSVQPHPQASTPQKLQSSQTRTSLWSTTAVSPSKAASPVQTNSHASSKLKIKWEEDLFWGPSDQSNQETKLEFPQLGNHGSWATKSTPGKGVSAASLSRQKSAGGRSLERSFSTSPASVQSSVKGKIDGSTKHSEAMDFRDWCESESVRLTGSKDTSFLEFCLKQSRSEAEILLTENLGSFDPNHEFIENFLNYMELLPADVIELAFQGRNDSKASNRGVKDMIFDNAGLGDFDRDYGAHADGSAKTAGGKKKGKKGKKVSPAVLGFNVVSNRIMMGEIQSVED